MKALAVVLLVGTASADTRKDVEKLLDVETIEPAAIAKALGGKLQPTVDTTPYRHETPIALAGYRDARVIVGGHGNAWRIVSLEPEGKLVLADVSGPLAKLPHSVEPRGPHMPGVTHRYHLAKHDLVVDLDEHDQLTRIILTTDVTK